MGHFGVRSVAKLNLPLSLPHPPPPLPSPRILAQQRWEVTIFVRPRFPSGADSPVPLASRLCRRLDFLRRPFVIPETTNIIHTYIHYIHTETLTKKRHRKISDERPRTTLFARKKSLRPITSCGRFFTTVSLLSICGIHIFWSCEIRQRTTHRTAFRETYGQAALEQARHAVRRRDQVERWRHDVAVVHEIHPHPGTGEFPLDVGIGLREYGVRGRVGAVLTERALTRALCFDNEN